MNCGQSEEAGSDDGGSASWRRQVVAKRSASSGHRPSAVDESGDLATINLHCSNWRSSLGLPLGTGKVPTGTRAAAIPGTARPPTTNATAPALGTVALVFRAKAPRRRRRLLLPDGHPVDGHLDSYAGPGVVPIRRTGGVPQRFSSTEFRRFGSATPPPTHHHPCRKSVVIERAIDERSAYPPVAQKE